MGFPYPRFIRSYQRTKLWSRTRPAANGCMEWTGSMAGNYPSMSLAGRTVGAHRVAWVAHNDAEIPDGYEIDHVCGNTACINPEHLEPVTRQENLRRSRAARGLIDPPPAGDKTCQYCGKVGTRGYRWVDNRWSCVNTDTCQKRIHVKRNPPPRVWWRCADCHHQRRRHNHRSDDGPRCYVVNCTCNGWEHDGIGA